MIRATSPGPPLASGSTRIPARDIAPTPFGFVCPPLRRRRHPAPGRGDQRRRSATYSSEVDGRPSSVCRSIDVDRTPPRRRPARPRRLAGLTLRRSVAPRGRPPATPALGLGPAAGRAAQVDEARSTSAPAATTSTASTPAPSPTRTAGQHGAPVEAIEHPATRSAPRRRRPRDGQRWGGARLEGAGSSHQVARMAATISPSVWRQTTVWPTGARPPNRVGTDHLEPTEMRPPTRARAHVHHPRSPTARRRRPRRRAFVAGGADRHTVAMRDDHMRSATSPTSSSPICRPLDGYSSPSRWRL